MIDSAEHPIDDMSMVTAQLWIAVECDEEIRGSIPKGPNPPITTIALELPMDAPEYPALHCLFFAIDVRKRQLPWIQEILISDIASLFSVAAYLQGDFIVSRLECDALLRRFNGPTGGFDRPKGTEDSHPRMLA